jgi:hypothetical protein
MDPTPITPIKMLFGILSYLPSLIQPRSNRYKFAGQISGLKKPIHSLAVNHNGKLLASGGVLIKHFAAFGVRDNNSNRRGWPEGLEHEEFKPIPGAALQRGSTRKYLLCELGYKIE